MAETAFPYKRFGSTIKRLREAAKETTAEVSGAVEIDEKLLSRIEQGKVQPSEDIVLLLINHFAIKEPEAEKLWLLAGYPERDDDEHDHAHGDEANEEGFRPQPAVMVLPVDARIVYSDMVHVVVNNYGVVMNFMQTSGNDMKPLAISRIGMSKEHAQSVLKVLQDTLQASEQAKKPKQIPPSDKSK